MSSAPMSIMDIVRKKKADIKAATGRNERAAKVAPGKNRYRILPGWRADKTDPTFFHDFSQHWIKKDGKLIAVAVCNEKTYGKPCSICTALMAGVTAAKSDDTIAELEEAVSRGRILVNALWLTAPDEADRKKPVILELSPTTFEKICELMEEYDDITHPTEGTDIIINRSGSGKNTEYSVMPSPKSVKVPAAILAKLNNIDEFIAAEAASGDNKALAAVSTVSGLLAAPSGSVGDDTAAAGSVSDDELFGDDTAHFEEPEEAPEPEKVTKSAPEPEEMTDEDMDELLAGLDDDLDLS